MSVTSVDKNFENLTLTLIADFDAAPERVWELWADPRRLERWWGPPTYPATFEQPPAAPIIIIEPAPTWDRMPYAEK